jgi:hypothetical protein
LELGVPTLHFTVTTTVLIASGINLLILIDQRESAADPRSDPDHLNQFRYSIGALLQSRLFFCCQLDLDDLFQAIGA